MDSSDDYQIGPKATILKEKLKQNRLYDDDRPETREEQARGASQKTTKKLMTSVEIQEKKLLELLSHGCQMVGNVEVASVNAEVTARIDDETQFLNWSQQISKEKQTTDKTLEKINKTWQKSLDIKVPQDLHIALQSLQEESNEIVNRKRELIEGLQKLIDVANATFNHEKTVQSQQRNQILSRTTEHVLELVQAYQQTHRELQFSAEVSVDNLEKYFTKELEKAVEDLNVNLHNLMNLRREKRIERMETLIKFHVRGVDKNEEAQKVKQDVEQILLDLYRLRARKKVEEEQLQFNLVVLKQQFKETTELVSEKGRRINFLRPIVTDYRKKWEEMEENKKRNQRQKMTELVKSKNKLRQLRARLSETSSKNASQLRGLSYMYYNKLNDQVMKIHEIERSIELIVLSREFVASDLSLLKELHPALQPSDTPALAAAARILGPPEDNFDIEVCEDERILEEAFLKQTVRAAKFLVNSSHELVFETDSPPLLTLEHLFWELGIKTEYDVDRILDSAKRKWYSKRTNTSENLLRVEVDSSSIFSTEEVLSTLVEFSRARALKERDDRIKAIDFSSDDNLTKVRFFSQEEEEKWKTLVDQTTKERTKTWLIIKEALKKYLNVLQGRQRESLAVENLRRENKELHQLLLGVGYPINVASVHASQ